MYVRVSATGSDHIWSFTRGVSSMIGKIKNMNKRNFLKISGMLGAASLIPVSSPLGGGNQAAQPSGCVLIPTETAGPFPLDLSGNSQFFRQDVREDRTGVPLRLKMKIIGQGNCLPMPNVRVNIWHCDKDGLYSGYSQNGNAGQAGLTYLRGYQYTNATGETEFLTIFPGWYSGRICHIHFQVYVSSSYAAISQLTFDIAPKNAVYLSRPDLYTKGADPLAPSQDNIFSDGYAYQLATLIHNTATGEYESFLEVTVAGSGATGIGHFEKENAKQFSLGQNFPNPYSGETTIPFRLHQPGDVKLEVWNVSGKRVAVVQKEDLPSGESQFHLHMNALGLPTGNYVYQLEVRNSTGIYTDTRMMTAGQ